MGRKERLYQKAKNSPTNFRFSELCSLAEMVGLVFRRQSGSHQIYKHPDLPGIMNFQPDKRDKGKAKIKQTKDLINFIDEHKLIGGRNV